MSDVAAGVGFFFSNPAPAPTENSDEDIDGHGAALACSGYNLNGMAGHYVVNPAGNIQITNNNMNMMGAHNNNNGVVMMNMDNLPSNQNHLQSNPTSTAGGMNFGNFLFNPLAMFYHQQQVQTAPQAAAAAVATPTPAAPTSTLMHQPQNNQYFTPAQSPMPQAFFTPRTGTPYSVGSPSQTPPPPTTSPFPQDQPSGALPQSLLPNHSSHTTNNNNNKKRKAPDDDDSPSRSLIRQGISSVGSALGVVATYINKSLQNGIPFHIADRAMKDSKETYSRWWDQTVVSDDKKYDRTRKGSTDDEIDDDDDSADDDERAAQPVRKKRKTGVDEEYGRASSLSQMLAGNYNDANIEAVKKNWRVGKSEVIHSQVVPDVRVDSSIIGPPRRQTSNSASTSGYDAFNNIGSMYGGDMFFANTTTFENSINTTIESDVGKYSTTYDSMSDYYVNSTEEDERKLASVPSSVKKYDSNTNGSNNTLGQTLQAIKEIIEEKNRVSDEQEIFQMSFKSPRDWVTRTIRSELVDALQSVQGDVTTKRFMSSLEVLTRFYRASGRDARANPWNVGGPAGADILEGSWLNISRPNYVECLGQNAENDFMYTLGRMSFDMFQPSNLICSVQSTHNTIKMIGEREELPACVPNSLKNEVASLCNSSDGDSASKRPLLRSYDIAVSMTIEPPSLAGQPNPNSTPSPTKRMRAVMSVKGYILPDPNIRNRLTVWFTGGRLGPAKLSRNGGDEFDDEEEKSICSEGNEYGDFKEWEVIFGKGKWRKAISERARDMAAKVLLGVDMPNKMEDDGHMEYNLNRPIGGHGKTYIDVLYLDDDILIMKGHHGTTYAMARSCVSQRYRNLQASISRT